jgi:aryl-alcohol dehydrogenase-like predicted oxidoreductase
MGEFSKETAFQTFDLYHSQGDNFIDTANNYQDDETEEWLGERLSAHKNCNGIVLAMTFFGNHILPHAKEGTILSNYGRNGSKALLSTCTTPSLNYEPTIWDILYVHW